MRTLVTFILRLWVDPQAEGPGWEGQVECVASEERAHVRGPDDLARFIEAQAVESGARHPVSQRRNEP
jgi:hypothetical protein